MNNSFLFLPRFFFAELWCIVVEFLFFLCFLSLALNNSKEKNKRENDLNSTCVRQHFVATTFSPSRSLSTVLLCIDLQWQTHSDVCLVCWTNSCNRDLCVVKKKHIIEKRKVKWCLWLCKQLARLGIGHSLHLLLTCIISRRKNIWWVELIWIICSLPSFFFRPMTIQNNLVYIHLIESK